MKNFIFLIMLGMATIVHASRVNVVNTQTRVDSKLASAITKLADMGNTIDQKALSAAVYVMNYMANLKYDNTSMPKWEQGINQLQTKSGMEEGFVKTALENLKSIMQQRVQATWAPTRTWKLSVVTGEPVDQWSTMGSSTDEELEILTATVIWFINNAPSDVKVVIGQNEKNRLKDKVGEFDIQKINDQDRKYTVPVSLLDNKPSSQANPPSGPITA